MATSFVENFTFEERTTAQFQSYKFGILLWDFQDIHSIDPILVLQSTLEILCFDFNPTDPNIVAAGTINGQIFLYDIKKEMQQLYQRKNQKTKQEKSNIFIEDQIIYVKPFITSTLQDPSSSSAQSSETVKRNVSSHRNPVTALCWLPPTIEFDKKAFFQYHQHPGGTATYQFVSFSEGGQILFWDTRFNEKVPIAFFVTPGNQAKRRPADHLEGQLRHAALPAGGRRPDVRLPPLFPEEHAQARDLWHLR